MSKNEKVLFEEIVDQLRKAIGIIEVKYPRSQFAELGVPEMILAFEAGRKKLGRLSK